MTDENNETLDQAKSKAVNIGIKVAVIGAALAGGTTLVAQYDELITALSKDKVEMAYNEGVKSQMQAVISQTQALSACNAAVICLEHKSVTADEIAVCKAIRDSQLGGQ